jgi:hypothetical protein
MLKKIAVMFFILIHAQLLQSMNINKDKVCHINEYQNWEHLLQVFDGPQMKNVMVVFDIDEILLSNSDGAASLKETGIRFLQKLKENKIPYFCFDSNCKSFYDIPARRLQFDAAGLSQYFASPSIFQEDILPTLDRDNAFCVDSQYGVVHILSYDDYKIDVGLTLEHLIGKKFLNNIGKLTFVGDFLQHVYALTYCINSNINVGMMYCIEHKAILDTPLESPVPSKSSIIRCDAWRNIEDILSENLADEPHKKVMVGFDVDEVLLDNSAQLVSLRIHRVLRKLTNENVERFCLTSCPSVFWRKRRNQLDAVGISKFFKNSNTFLKQWNSSDEDNPFYVDADYSIAYSVRMLQSCQEREAPPEEQDLYSNIEEYATVIDKGSAFVELIKKGFLAKPDKLIFTDDLLDNLIMIQQRCILEKIDFVGIWYA